MKNTVNHSPTLQSIIAIRDQKRALYDLPGELTPANNFSSAAKMFDLYLATRPGGKEAPIDDIDIAVFMTIVKLCRIAIAKEHMDNYPDAANYLILAGDRAYERIERKSRQGDMLDAVAMTMQANKGAATSGLRRDDNPLRNFKMPSRMDGIVISQDPAADIAPEERKANRNREMFRVQCHNVAKKILGDSDQCTIVPKDIVGWPMMIDMLKVCRELNAGEAGKVPAPLNDEVSSFTITRNQIPTGGTSLTVMVSVHGTRDNFPMLFASKESA